MRRRLFLQAMAAGAAAWALPARGDTSAGASTSVKLAPSTERRKLRSAIARARRRGAPLLVLVIPASGDELKERAALFSEFLEQGTEAQIALASQPELVSVTAVELRAVAPVAGEPLFAVLMPNGSFTVGPTSFPRLGKPYDQMTESEMHAVVAKRAAFVAAELARALPPELAGRKARKSSELFFDLRLPIGQLTGR
jgi:hypothetical protein